MITGVSAAGRNSAANEQIKKQRELRAKGQFEVKRGMTLSQLAKKFNMSVEDFKKMTGLKSSDITGGQIIKNVPVATVESGKGLVSIAREHGMSLKDFCELNGIDKNYQPQKGEKFYVYPKKQAAKSQTTTKTQKSTDGPATAKTSQPAKTAATKTAASDAKPKTAAKTAAVKPAAKSQPAQVQTSASDIAKDLKASSKMIAAVGKDKFTTPFNKINKKNVIGVIKQYDKISPKESLIGMISSEWGSSKQERMSSITKLYDTLAQAVGSSIATPEKRTAFMNELNKEFDSWGFVDTKKMDSMINDLISAVSSKPVYGKDGVEIARAGKRSVASSGAKPPIPKDKEGNITAEVIRFLPENKTGPLAGKTITVNAGHGWAKNGTFKPGTNAEDSNGKTIHEWYKNRNFADKLIKDLTAQGATVIYTAGDAAPVCDAKRKYKSDMLISLHCNSAPSNPNRNGLEIFYPAGSEEGKKLAQIADNHLDKLVSFGVKGGPNDRCIVKADSETQHDSIGILQVNKETVPSILIEMGFQSNEKDLKNIDSKTFQTNSMNQVTEAIIQYFKEKK